MGKWQGVLLGGGALLVLAGASLILGSAGGASGQSPAAVVIAPPSHKIGINDGEFNIEVQVKNVQNLGAYEIALTFDTSKLEFLGVSGAGFLTTTTRSESCVGTTPGPEGDPVKHANRTGAITYGCNTNGLIENNQGTFGPNGDGTLAYVAFKPRAVGDSPLVLKGWDGPYIIDKDENGAVIERGQTFLTAVEVCPNSECPLGLPSLDMTTLTGIVKVEDPAAGPTATALPATPTVEPARPTPDTQATVRAVLGEPERRLTDGATTSSAPPGSAGSGAPTGNVAGDSGTTSGGTSSGNTASGQSGSTAPGAVGPDGAPIAGHGPQNDDNPWPARAGVALAIIGALALAAGAAARRRTA